MLMSSRLEYALKASKFTIPTLRHGLFKHLSASLDSRYCKSQGQETTLELLASEWSEWRPFEGRNLA